MHAPGDSPAKPAPQKSLRRAAPPPDAVVPAARVLTTDGEPAEGGTRVRAHDPHVERLVAERTARLALVNEELEAFTYAVSHDLRAHLRGLAVYSRVLSEDYRDVLDEDGRHMLGRLSDEAERLTGLVNGLLDMSRVTREDLRREPLDVSAMARECLEQLARAEPARRVDVRVAEDVRAHADAHLTRIVLENLLQNAWKYTSRRRAASIVVGTVTVDGKPVTFVRDNGVGFDAASVGARFLPFRRYHARDDFEGTGVGLATVQRVVDRHGGRIWAESTPGAGATFYFTLSA